MIERAGPKSRRRFLEFFVVTIRNANTRRAYARACRDFFEWVEKRSPGIELIDIEPTHVAAWIEYLGKSDVGLSAPSVKQSLAALRMLFDWLVTGHVIAVNPAWSVRGPRHVVKKGKTPVLSAAQARELLDSIALARTNRSGSTVADLIGLRDRAIIAVMVYSFARIGAVVKMDVADYWQNGKRWWLRLHEKGGKHHEVPVHHNAEAYLDEYLHASGMSELLDSPLFRSADRKSGRLTLNRFSAHDALRMIKRRAKRLGLPHGTCCHTFRATGITAYLDNGGSIENAQAIAAHESPRTTKLYDRTGDDISLDEIEKIVI